jgi:UDP-N-acetyl-D-mannosaminuronic acid dehydrogenase
MSLPESLADQEICVVGLGYIGLTLAVAMADTGFRVHGIEIRDTVLDQLRNGQPHFWEPRLTQKLQRVIKQGRFTFSQEPDCSFSATVYILTVGTPLGIDGKADLKAVKRSAQQVASHMREGALVILRSTVKLGTTRKIIQPILQATGRPFEIAFCPERTLEGKALIELHELPQIIGADNAQTRARCARIFGALTPMTLSVSSLEAAELIKLIDNAYRDVTFAFANEVARLCSHAGLSATEIIQAGKLGYPRTHVAMPGPVGGPCLTKDPHILVESADEIGLDLPITRAARAINELQPRETICLIKRQAELLDGFPKDPLITVAGLAFKGWPPTDDLRGTMARPMLIALRELFSTATIRGYDPVVEAEDARIHLGIETVCSLEEAFKDAHVVVIANDHEIFQRMDVPSLTALMSKPGIVYDYWNLHEQTRDAMPAGVVYLSLGCEKFVRETT